MSHKSARCALLFVLLSFFALLSSCGGGGGGSSSTPPPSASAPAATLGTFVDAPVSGLNYSASPSGLTGVTDAFGHFNFKTGDTVTFTAAGVPLGSFAPTVATDGTANVTPLNLTGATSVTDPKATAIAQFLATLNVLAVSQGAGKTGIYVIPSSTSLQTQLATLNTTAPNLSAAQLQAVLDAVFGAGKFTVTPAATAQTALQQGVTSQTVIGTVWTGSCTCGGGGTFYFQSDGTLIGFTDSGDMLSGSWAANTSATGAGIQINLFSSGGGYSKNGFIAAGASTGSAEIYSSTGALQGKFTFTKLIGASSAAVTTTYGGGWYVAFTATAAGVAAGNSNGSAYTIAAPNGTFLVVTNDGAVFSGTWNPATGQGNATFTDKSGKVNTVSVDFSTATGSVSSGGVVVGTLALTRTGTFNRAPGGGKQIPLVLNIVTSWANLANTTNSIAVSLSVNDATGAQVAFGTKSTSEPPSSSGVRTSTTDNVAVSYPTGAGKTYTVSVGQQNCTVANGSGTVVDANSGNANAYPTVYITCDPNATPSPPIPLLLNVSTSWANTATSVSSFAVQTDIFDSTGAQIAFGVKSLVEGNHALGTRSTTTDNLAVSYTKGRGATYRITVGPATQAQCAITGGGSGAVVDANAGNAAAYPTLTLVCN